MTHKALGIANPQKLQKSISDFSKKNKLGWVDLEAASFEVLGRLEDSINAHGSMDVEIECGTKLRNNLCFLGLDNLKGVSVEEVSVD